MGILSKDYNISVPAHHIVYSHGDTSKPRNLEVYFSIPDHGINKETGIVFFVQGFKANVNSNVYKKMRSLFADQYNLVTIQCHYFGQDYMENKQVFNPDINDLKQKLKEKDFKSIFINNKLNANRLFEVARQYPNLTLLQHVKYNETLSNFNDMGIMQCLDILTALYSVFEIIKDNELLFNTKKIIFYGNSHGSYLSYLCNAFAPNLISLIIDNSSWLISPYLSEPAKFGVNINDINLLIFVDYLASHLPYDKEILYLPSLYSKFTNKCRIVSYNGASESIFNLREKKEFCDSIPFTEFIEVTDEKVDGQIFKSTNHGLDADFLKLFDLVMRNRDFQVSTTINQEDILLKTSKCEYRLCYDKSIPMLEIIK